MNHFLKNAKTLFTVFILVSILNSSCKTTEPVAHQQPAPKAPSPHPSVSYQTFYEELSPYGQWINNPIHGYVWIPAAGPDFVPYSTAGYWVCSDYGWTWVSDYSWGWAPFHYGLWDYDNFYGWYWIPNTVWGPAWVAWRRTPDYYGWAPLGSNYNFNGENPDYYNMPTDRWVFVQEQYINSPNHYQHYAPRGEYEGYIKNSTPIIRTHYDNEMHVTYISGPETVEVEKVTGKPVRPFVFKESPTPGHTSESNGELSMYRPAVEKNNPNNSKPIPKTVSAMSEVKPVKERPAVPQNMNPVKRKMAPEENQKEAPNAEHKKQEDNNSKAIEKEKREEEKRNNESKQEPKKDNSDQEKVHDQPKPQVKNNNAADNSKQKQNKPATPKANTDKKKPAPKPNTKSNTDTKK